jgi:hypothetical protein
MGHRTPQEHLWFHQGQWSQRSRGSGPPHLKELLLSLPWCLKYFEVIESLILKQVPEWHSKELQYTGTFAS